MPATLQLTLSAPEAFHPVPAGTGHYVVALQTKKGELDALRWTDPSTWAHLTPLVEVLGPKSPGTAPFRKSRVEGWVKKVADSVGRHPLFLDYLRLSPNHSTAAGGGSEPVLSVIHAAARKRDLNFVPVASLSDATATVSQIADTAAADGRGVALRLRVLETVSADGRAIDALVRERLDDLGVGVTGADLLLDMRHLTEDSDVDVGLFANEIDDLVSIGDWRSIVMLGTTMPRSLGGGVVEAGTVGRLPRREWRLWSSLRESQIARLPTYGDYAIQHPEPPLDIGEGQIPIGIRGAIRYTHTTQTVIPRAKAPRHEEGREQYRRLCSVLVQQPEFAGAEYTWGDRQIAECADGTCEPGWEEHWRGAGTSHHLRFVVDQLASIPGVR